MPPPGARGPPGRGAPSPREQRPAMDRTSSLPNLGNLTTPAHRREEPGRSQQDDAARRQGRPCATDSPASPPPISPTRYSAPLSKCRPVPAKTPVPADRKSTVRTPENQFSTISPTTHITQSQSVNRSNSNSSRAGTNPRPTNQQSGQVTDEFQSPATQTSARTNRGQAPIPSRTTSRTTQGAPQTSHRVPSTQPTRTASAPTPRPTLGQSATGIKSHSSHLHDSRTNRDTRHQMAPVVASTTNTGSPAPPRTSAYDSPAHRSGQSSISGSNTSLASIGHRAELESDLMTPSSPTPSMEVDFDFQTGGRGLRRRRSPDETADEEAKRHCIDTQRTQAQKSPTFADAVRRPHSPNAIAGNRYAQNVPTRVGISPTPTPITNTPLDSATAANNSTVADKKKKRPRYPPLIVEKLPNWATHFRAIAAKLGRPPNARPFGQGVRFSPESEEEYRVVQKYLIVLEKEQNISWFAYSLQADKKLKVAIKGLPADTDPQEIEEELRTLGFEPEYVRHINARQGRPGCVFHAVLNKTENVRSIFDTSTFMFMRGVKIEAWRGKRGPAQCHRCQHFRHSSHQCHRPLACVRCGEGHTARECPRPREEPATCANCGGAHPANNVKCPVFQREIKNRRAGTVAITTTSSRRPQKQHQNTTEQPQEENQGASLMATANGPTQRGQTTTSSGRRKKKRGGKDKKSIPPATSTQDPTQEAAPANHQTQAVKIRHEKEKQNPHLQQSGKTTGIAANTDLEAQRRHLSVKNRSNRSADQSAETRINSATNQKAALVRTDQKNKNFTACAIQLLMDLIKAIRQGQDVEQVILDGLATLLTLYHG